MPGRRGQERPTPSPALSRWALGAGVLLIALSLVLAACLQSVPGANAVRQQTAKPTDHSQGDAQTQSNAQPPSSAQPPSNTQNIVVVSVPVADLHDSPTRSSSRVTQAFLGTHLSVLARERGWYKVKVPSQVDYPGWIAAEHALPLGVGEGQTGIGLDRKVAVVTEPFSLTRREPSPQAEQVARIPMGTRLPIVSQRGTWYELALPGGEHGWIRVEDIRVAPLLEGGGRSPRASGLDEAVLSSALSFLGTPYLWGGMTADGIDCSGFTFVAFDTNGVKIPRDADLQYEVGRPIRREELRSGDLVFFSTYAPGPSHVGIYMGDSRFVDASSSKGVSISSLDDPYYSARYIGARRILGE